MHAERRPTYIQAALFPQALTLEAYRQTLPESQRHETFRFLMVQWDIVKARFLIQQSNKRLDTLRVRDAARAYGLDTSQSIDSWAHVDETRAMSDEIDTIIPVILALIQGDEGTRPKPILIDGLHRLYKAYREGKETIPCYALTSEEEKQCRLWPSPPS